MPCDLSSPVGQSRVVQFAQLSTCYNGGMSSKFLVCWTGNWKSYAFEIHPYYIVYLCIHLFCSVAFCFMNRAQLWIHPQVDVHLDCFQFKVRIKRL